MPLMLRHKVKRLFDPARPVFARRELTIGDRVFRVGDEIHLAQLGVPLPTAQLWFRVRYIGHDRLVTNQPDDGVARDAEPLTTPQGERIDMITDQAEEVEVIVEPVAEEPPPTPVKPRKR